MKLKDFAYSGKLSNPPLKKLFSTHLYRELVLFISYTNVYVFTCQIFSLYYK